MAATGDRTPMSMRGWARGLHRRRSVRFFNRGWRGAAAVTTRFAASCGVWLGISSHFFINTVTIGVFAFLAAINVRGVRVGARLVEVATVAKLVPLISFVIIGIFFIDPARLRWDVMPSASAVLQASGVLIFAFCGIESALIPSGEVRTPARTVPVAAFIAICASTALYLAIHCVAQGVLGTALANDRVTPLATAAASFAGPVGRTFMIVGATLSMFGYLSFAALAGPRSLFAFARDGLLPRALAGVHSRYLTPWVAIVTYCGAGVLLALSGTFERLAVLANLSAIVLYAMCAVSAWVLRRRGVRLAEEPFVTPGGPLIPVLTCAGLAWLFVETFTRDYLIASVVTIVAVVILYGVRALRGKASAVSA